MLPEVEGLRFQSLWLLKKALPSREEPASYPGQFENGPGYEAREEPDVSLSIVNNTACFYTHALHQLRAYY